MPVMVDANRRFSHQLQMAVTRNSRTHSGSFRFPVFGVTAIRTGAGISNQAAETRLEIQKGWAIGPRIVASGPAVGGIQTAQSWYRLAVQSFGTCGLHPGSSGSFSRGVFSAGGTSAALEAAARWCGSTAFAVASRKREAGIHRWLSNLGVPPPDDTVVSLLKCAYGIVLAAYLPSKPKNLCQAVSLSPRLPNATR